MRRFQVAEECGLVTVLLDDAKRPPAWEKQVAFGVRLRLNPRSSHLREDGHLFIEQDLQLLSGSDLKKATRGSRWTDTTIGCKRVTPSYGVRTLREAEELCEQLEALSFKPWKIEEVLLERNNRARLERLDRDASWSRSPDLRPNARFQRALASRKPRGYGLYAQCALNTSRPSLRQVKSGLVWLDAQLARLEPYVLEAIAAPEGCRLVAYVNLHPRFRQFEFRVEAGTEDEDPPEFDDAHALVLEQLLTAPQDQTRRIAGILWKYGVNSLRGTQRIKIAAES